MELRSTARRLFHTPGPPIPTAAPFHFPIEDMATDLTMISKSIAGLIIPVPPLIETCITLLLRFFPAFKALLLSLSPHLRIYLHLFFPPQNWVQADIDNNLQQCSVADPGAYPIYDPASGMDHATYHALEARFKRTSSKHGDCLCFHHVIMQFLIRAIPPRLQPIIFHGDLDFAINMDPTAIFQAIRTHFAVPSMSDYHTLATAFKAPFLYVDSNSLDTYLSEFQITVSTYALIGAPMAQSQQVSQLSENFQASPDADVFAFALQLYEQTHSAMTAVTLPSLLFSLKPVNSALITKHSKSASSPIYSINAAAKDRKPKTPNVSKDFGGYCWSHGNKNHTSDQCKNPHAGHPPLCTWQNRKEFPGFCVPPNYGQRDKNTKA